MHEVLATATLQENIDVVIVPRFVPTLVRWLNETIREPELPPVADLHKYIVRPMIAQIKIDLARRWPTSPPRGCAWTKTRRV